MKKRYITLFTLIITTSFLIAQQLPRKAMILSEKDSLIFFDFKAQAEANKWDVLPLNEFIVKTGEYFLNTPYVGHTLEVGDSEQLVINLRELDCTTFVESCLALTRTVRWGKVGLDTYCTELEKIRYRNGVMTDYTSRNHYFTDWIFDNQQLGLVKDMTQEFGGIPFPVKVNFMSTHPEKYRQLANNKDFVPRMMHIEKQICKRNYFYIPKENLTKVEKKIKSGDIIAITTNMDGLDIAHVGYAIWQKGELHFMHASSTGKKVMISDKSLLNYLIDKKQDTGIMVIRPLN